MTDAELVEAYRAQVVFDARGATRSSDTGTLHEEVADAGVAVSARTPR